MSVGSVIVLGTVLWCEPLELQVRWLFLFSSSDFLGSVVLRVLSRWGLRSTALLFLSACAVAECVFWCVG